MILALSQHRFPNPEWFHICRQKILIWNVIYNSNVVKHLSITTDLQFLRLCIDAINVFRTYDPELEVGERHMIMYFGIQNSFEVSNNLHSGELPYYLDSVSVSVTNRQEWNVSSSKCALLIEFKHDRKFVCDGKVVETYYSSLIQQLPNLCLHAVHNYFQ